MPGRLQDKIALVTGAGSVGPGWGNGKATATLFAREGAKVFAVDRNPEAVEETRGIIEAEGGTCVAHATDVTKNGNVKAMVETCLGAFGRIDILYNNVGGSAPGGPVEMSEEVWDQQMDQNLKHVFLACKHVLPVMESQGKGAIVNIGSIAGLRHFGPDVIGYSATKAAVIQFTRALGVQYAKRGIRANTVVPGLMHTPLVDVRLVGQRAGGDRDSLLASRHAQVPTGQMGDAWDVAYAALYLASDEAKYVTATEIVVDGGITARC